MEVITKPLGMIQANCYIIFNKKNPLKSELKSDAVVIDPGAESEKIVEILNEKELNLKYIILTHGHSDHIGAAAELNRLTKAPVLVHMDDESMLRDPKMNFSASIPGFIPISVKADWLLVDGEEIDFSGKKIKVIHTPGHTLGGISLVIGNWVFTGDTLFRGSIGRTDLGGGNIEALKISIVDKLYTLPDETLVFPGHGPASTIGWEKENNYYFNNRKDRINNNI